MSELIVHAIARSPVAEPPAGLRGTALRWIEGDGLGAWVTDASTLGPLGRDDAFDHHRIVAALHAAAPHLPVRFPTRVDGDAACLALLAARSEDLHASLQRIAGRLEIAVTLLWRDAAVEPGRGHAVAPATGGPGRTFLERKRADAVVSEERRAAARRMAEELTMRLTVEQADVRHDICPSSEVALSTAILAPAGEGERAKEAAVRVASGFEGVRAVVSGPWPPYTFASAA